jgi:hypothetical protein
MLLSDTAISFPNGVGVEYTLMEKVDDTTWVLKHTYELQQRPWRPTFKFTMDTFSESDNDKLNISVCFWRQFPCSKCNCGQVAPSWRKIGTSDTHE